MSDYPDQSTAPQTEPVCPRHPERVSYARCNRCMRPACGQCQIHLDVGMMCPDCYRESTGRTRPAPRYTLATGTPVITYTLIGVNVIMYLLQMLIPNHLIYQELAFKADWVEYSGQYYRALTGGFLHSPADPSHLLLNMLSLYLFGNVLERMLGRWKYLFMYLLSILGGSAAVWLLDPSSTVVGASGGIFGLMGSYLVLMLVLGQRDNVRSLLVLLAINVVYGFIVPNVSWQAHLGGMLTGAVVTAILVAPHITNPSRR